MKGFYPATVSAPPFPFGVARNLHLLQKGPKWEGKRSVPPQIEKERLEMRFNLTKLLIFLKLQRRK